MPEEKDSKVVLINKSDKKIFIKRRPAPVASETQNSSSTNLVSESPQSNLVITNSSGDSWPISATDYPEIHEKIVKSENAASVASIE